jgi:hypothetical protein
MSEAQKFSVVRHTGRLVEARVFALWTEADAVEYAKKLELVVRTLAGQRPVLLADHRPVRVYPTSVAERLIQLFTDMNLSLERVALVVTQGNVPLTLQLQRLVDDAENSRRKLFSDPASAVTHLSVALDDAERRRATDFLSQV